MERRRLWIIHRLPPIAVRDGKRSEVTSAQFTKDSGTPGGGESGGGTSGGGSSSTTKTETTTNPDGTDPNGIITRAQMVTMLWRAAGMSGGVTAETAFTDVPADSYYVKAVAWAVEHGITTGIGNGKFDPNGTCTRAQIVTFLHRSYLSK